MQFWMLCSPSEPGSCDYCDYLLAGAHGTNGSSDPLEAQGTQEDPKSMTRGGHVCVLGHNDFAEEL